MGWTMNESRPRTRRPSRNREDGMLLSVLVVAFDAVVRLDQPEDERLHHSGLPHMSFVSP